MKPGIEAMIGFASWKAFSNSSSFAGTTSRTATSRIIGPPWTHIFHGKPARRRNLWLFETGGLCEFQAFVIRALNPTGISPGTVNFLEETTHREARPSRYEHCPPTR